MSLSTADLSTLSRLLDEALDLEPARAEAWLAALPEAHRHLLPPLREMLAQHLSPGRAGFMSDGPKLEGGAVDETVARAEDLVGPYRLICEIGRGGMGAVWLAERADGSLKRQVALKLPRLAWGAGLAERMARERDIGALLAHPNIARLYDAGVDASGRPYLALEYIDGQVLDAWCEAKALGVPDRLRLFLQVARAVAYAHGRLVVHRDLKPSNVLVSTDGQAHLLDFGIAKLLHEAAPGDMELTQEQGRVLTPHYASPEQIQGETITVASDVYSLGVLLYELLTGRLPFQPTSPAALEAAVLEGEPPLASSRAQNKATARMLRGEIDAILGKALKRAPTQRYVTVDALAQDIERYLQGDTVLARPDSALYRLRKTLRRNWVSVTAAAAVFVAVLSGSFVAVLQAQRATRSAERERVVKEFIADVFRVNSRVDPNNAALRPASTQALLEGGAQLIQQRFAGQPELQAELYGVVGGVFSDMGAYKLAVDYATRQVETLALTSSSERDQARAQLDLAQALFDDRRDIESESRARRALEMARGNLQLELDVLLLLARIQATGSKYDETAATLDEAEIRLKAIGPRPSAALAWVLAMRARLLSVGNQLDEAAYLFDQAINTALLSEGPLSNAAIKIRLIVASRLGQTAYSDQSQRHFDAAISALRSLGGAHDVRAALESARYAFARLGGDPTQARANVAALERSRATLVAAQVPVPERFIPQVEFWLGIATLELGDIAGARPLLETNSALLRETAISPIERARVSQGMGLLFMYAGDHERADPLLRDWLDARLRGSGSGRHPYVAFDYIYVAENLRMKGDYDAAQAVLEQAPHFEPMRGEGWNPDRYNRHLGQARARLRLTQGDALGALSLIENEAPGSDELSFDIESHRSLFGEALCAVGRSTQGLALLKLQLAQDEQGADYPQAPWLARLRAVAGLCAIQNHDLASAAAFATQARAAFSTQPGVSPFYKRPLFELEKRLVRKRGSSLR